MSSRRAARWPGELLAFRSCFDGIHMQTNRVDRVDRTLSTPLTRRSLMAAALGVGAVTVSGCSDHGGSPTEAVTGSSGSPSGSPSAASGTPSGPPTREQIITEFESRQPEA